MDSLKNINISTKYLNLNNKKLKEIPKEIAELKNLEELYLNNNQLKEIPKEIAELKNLEELYLGFNKLISLPNEISNLKELVALDLEHNEISFIQENLSYINTIDLNYNKLKELPSTFFEKIKLDQEVNRGSNGIFVYKNPLVSPPLELIETGGKSLSKYYEALSEGSSLLKEVKIIFIGEGSAGKTSIINRITKDKFNQHEPKTHGVRVNKKDDNDKKLYFWDFGGQDIMHSTHQFFLSKRCIYVLVLDGRKDEKPKYWLDMIKSFGGDSPVFIAMNKKEKSNTFDFSQKTLQKDYPSIVDFIELNCSIDNDYGTKELKENLLNFIHNSNNEQLSLNTPIPTKWENIKNELLKSPLNHQEHNVFHEKCDIEEIEHSHRNILLSLLHELGIMLHFSGETILQNYFILKPKWVLDAAYKIINSPIAKRMNGKVKNDKIIEILNYKDFEEFKQYPELEHYNFNPAEGEFIKSLFKEFKLGYMIGQDMLIPDLLPSEYEDYEDFNEDSIHVMYQYHFMPSSIMPQIIVSLHEDIKENLVWKNGALLSNDTFNCEAEIISDKERKTIHIRVQGYDKKEYLAVIRDTIKKINDKFDTDTTKPELHLVLKDSNCQPKPIPYKHLKQLEEEGDDTYRPVSANNIPCKKYELKELLGEMRSKAEEEELLIKNVLEELKNINEKLSKEEIEEKILNYKGSLGFVEINLESIYNKINEGLLKFHTKYIL